MFAPGDPRRDELLRLAEAATGPGLPEARRPRWRELVGELLGQVKAGQSSIPERRQQLRAAAELEVHILSPDEMASLATSTVGSGGLSLRIAEVVPAGTILELSIKVPQRKVPLLVRASVAWSRPGELGASFVDIQQSDRELIEAIAVQAVLSR